VRSGTCRSSSLPTMGERLWSWRDRQFQKRPKKLAFMR